MADFQPPSFSLGLDFDFDSHPQTTVRTNSSLCEQSRPASSNPSFRLIEDDDYFEAPTPGGDPQVSEPHRTFKRLRRGIASDSAPAAQNREPMGADRNIDDDIEEFSSSQEDRRGAKAHSSSFRSGCGSSKFSLHGHGVLTTQSASQCKATKRKQTLNTPLSASFETSSNKLMFPKLTVSPLRRFQLIDSDSDDASLSENANREANKVSSSLKGKKCNYGQYPTASAQNIAEVSVNMSQSEDLWKDFYTKKSFHIPTPALDEVCEEYFRSVKDKNEARNLMPDKCARDYKGSYKKCDVINNEEPQCKLVGNTPAHRYFFHDDPRIRTLVRNRLPYFFPLDAMNNRGNMHPVSSVIDYMSQFNHGECSSQQASGKTKAATTSTRGRMNLKTSHAEEVSQGSGSWMNPKCSVGIPKDAGKRRVHAVGRSAGHWYTAADGKKVYVTTNGQEFTGRIAYRHYKKENGAGFKKSKSKTKTAAKKGTSAKKGTAAKKRTGVKKKAAAKKK
ncbi:hypothetical protein U1Q18_024073 [Sarracenia purpurea var. burkii]